MEVFETSNYYIFVKQDKSLWWNRQTSEFTIKAGWDLSSVDDIECIGITQGIVGVISLPNVYEPHLIVIKEAIPVGVLYAPHLVYKIKSICILSADEPDTTLSNCSRHSRSSNTTPTHTSTNNNNTTSSNNVNTTTTKGKLFEGAQLMNKTWGAVKSAGHTIKNTTQQAAAIASNQVKSSLGNKDPTRIGKRITEELHKIFDDTDSFYYSYDCDITNNLQRHSTPIISLQQAVSQKNWDERFFWNLYMIRDIISLKDATWVLPIIQGFVQVENCVVGNECFTFALVSRRSRHRAGTRYKRRGVDEKGNCANYVETEQILTFRHHHLAFTQVRGSVPIYWSQPGYKYRPPPRLDRGEAETEEAFVKHFTKELELYEKVCIVNLVEQNGKEKLIGDAYARYVLKYNNERIIYVTFDFHDHCRGMRFENVSALVTALAPEAGAMGFHWRDQRGIICAQKAVFRVNCMDCLDRTNVVQTAIGKAVLESQLVKLGLAPPYTPLLEELKVPFMVSWANNGDIISRQYAGTNALKGDYTRTGSRKISGMMKDGMNSANRFFIQNFADSFRQSVIDLMHGNVEHEAELQEDKFMKTMLLILYQPLRIPLSGHYNAGVMGPELKLLEHVIYTGYYLARFKDTYRQATIDLMLGHQVSAESLSALGGQAVPDESDAMESAEQGKMLVEDCRRLLLGNSQYPVGAWGLIDADPNTGDINETEVDSVLLLTDDCYIVAEYDSHLDKIVRFEKVPLNNITLIELGVYQQTKLFQGPAPAFQCMRINYVWDGTDGYFHMFRSANLRFFNNTAYPIKSQEELIEFMNSIMDMFRIALDNIGKSDVQFLTGVCLQRRKSKNPGLDVARGMPRNLSESQLVQLSSKAISNVAGQFSKLGQSLKSKQQKPATTNFHTAVYQSNIDTCEEANEKAFFTVSGKNTDSHSGSDSEEQDSSIFEREVELALSASMLDNSNYNENSFLPSVGIVMGQNNENAEPSVSNVGKTQDLQNVSISSVMDHVSLPSGLLENAPPVRPITPNPQICVQSSETAEEVKDSQYFSGERILSRSMNSSPTEGGRTMKQLKNMTNPLSKIAKGMHNLGLNLDPRKMGSRPNSASGSAENTPPERSANNRAQLLEMWEESKCQTKLIAL